MVFIYVTNTTICSSQLHDINLNFNREFVFIVTKLENCNSSENNNKVWHSKLYSIHLNNFSEFLSISAISLKISFGINRDCHCVIWACMCYATNNLLVLIFVYSTCTNTLFLFARVNHFSLDVLVSSNLQIFTKIIWKMRYKINRNILSIYYHLIMW